MKLSSIVILAALVVAPNHVAANKPVKKKDLVECWFEAHNNATAGAPTECVDPTGSFAVDAASVANDPLIGPLTFASFGGAAGTTIGLYFPTVATLDSQIFVETERLAAGKSGPSTYGTKADHEINVPGAVAAINATLGPEAANQLQAACDICQAQSLSCHLRSCLSLEMTFANDLITNVTDFLEGSEITCQTAIGENPELTVIPSAVTGSPLSCFEDTEGNED